MGYVPAGTGQAEKVSDLVVVRMRQPFAFRMVDPWSGALVVPFARSVQLILPVLLDDHRALEFLLKVSGNL